MSNELQVNMRFTADASQAKAQLQSLQSQLSSLTSGNMNRFSSFGFTKEINESIVMAKQLQGILNSSVDSNTGLLNLSSFNTNLQKSGASLTQYANALQNLGPEGQRAFSQIASAINKADVPIKQTNGLLKQFSNTFMNTLRWQAASSLIHGMVGAIKGAFTYVQDLDTSLNRIRIVTGQSKDQMAEFAQQANKAAQELSTTTNEYAKASLIYFQQGLKGEDVTERANITTKMANVSGQSAQVVSDQLTAVWNNFAKGSDNLEHFADVMVRLGADTASSSDEIAQGLEKFAAVSDTVGLSYEHAAAALATVTATTRQSADVVGTAFKTIFARMEGLKLGETLDDGTTLNQYSEALAKAGVSIKDASGQLKDMDLILDETMAKWDTLSRDQQIALAQQVAGLRQYQQFIALMDNSDFFQQNLNRAENADGSLQNQSDIYKESWEAAIKEVKAAWEEFYQEMINPDMIIDILNGFKDFVNLISSAVKGIGGMRTIFLMIGAIITRVFQEQLGRSIDNFVVKVQNAGQHVKSWITKTPYQPVKSSATQQAENLKMEANQIMQNMPDDGTRSGSAAVDVYKKQAEFLDQIREKKNEILESGRKLSESELELVGIYSDINELLGQQVIKQSQVAEKSENKFNDQAQKVKELYDSSKLGSFDGKEGAAYNVAEDADGNKFNPVVDISENIQQYVQLNKQAGLCKTTIGNMSKEMHKLTDDGIRLTPDFNAETLENARNQLEQIVSAAEEAGVSLEPELKDKMLSLAQNDGINSVADFVAELDKIMVSAEQPQRALNQLKEQIMQFANTGHMSQEAANNLIQELEQLGTDAEQAGNDVGILVNALKALGINIDQGKEKLGGMNGSVIGAGQQFSAVTSMITSATMALSMMQGAISTLFSEDTSTGEKIISILTSVGMAIGMLAPLFQKNTLATLQAASASIAAAFGYKVAGKAAEEAGKDMATAGTAAQVGLGPLLLFVAAAVAVIAIVAAIVQAWQNQDKAEKEAAEAAEELNQKYKDLSDSSKDLQDGLEDLIQTFEDQKKAGEDTTESLEKLKKQLQDIRKNFKDLGVDDATLDLLQQAEAVGIATSNWAQYDNVLEQANKQAERNQKQATIDSATKQAESAMATFIKGQGYTNTYFVDNQGEKTTYSLDDYADGKITKVFEVNRKIGGGTYGIPDWAKEKYGQILQNVDGNKAVLKLRGDSAQAFAEDYALFKQLMEELSTHPDLVAGSDGMGWVGELQNEMESIKESGDALLEVIDEATKAQIDIGLEDAGIDASAISSLDEYQALLSAITEKLQGLGLTAEEAYSKAKDYMANTVNDPNLVKYSNFIDQFNRKMLTDVIYKHTDSDKNRSSKDILIDYKYSEEEAKGQADQFYEWFATQSSEDKEIAMKVNLDYIDSFQEFQDSFNRMKEFEKKVKLVIDDNPEENLKEAKTIRDNLSDIMETLSDQGYLTTSQAAEFIEKYPQYANYLVKTAKGYSLSQLAIDNYNGALKDEKKALDEIIDTNQNFGTSLKSFGENLISLEQLFGTDTSLQSWVKDMTDLTTQFISGEIESKKFFNQFNGYIDNLFNSAIFSEELHSGDIYDLINSVMPEIVNGMSDYANALSSAFTAGKISGYEFQQEMINVSNTLLETFRKSQEAIKKYYNTTNLKNYLEDENKSIDELTEEQDKQIVSRYRELSKKINSLQDTIASAESFSPILERFQKFYNKLSEYFEEDFSFKVDIDLDSEEVIQDFKEMVTEIDNLIDTSNLGENSFKAMYKALGNNSSSIIEEANKNLTGIAGKVEKSWKDSGKTVDEQANNIQKVAQGLRDGTIDANALSAQENASFMQGILSSGAATMAQLGNAMDQVFDGVKKVVENFKLSINFTVSNNAKRVPISVTDKDGKNAYTLYIPEFSISATGANNSSGGGGSGLSLDDYIKEKKRQANFNEGLNQIKNAFTTLMGNGGINPLDYYRPTQNTPGNVGGINLDNNPTGSNSGGDSGSKDGSGSGDENKPDLTFPEVEEYVDPKKLEEEAERYHEIVEALDDFERALDRVSAKKDEAFGAAKLKYMDEEIAKMEKLVSLDDQYLDEIAGNLEADQNKLLPYGIKFDEDGRISNYDEIVQQEMDNWKKEKDHITDMRNEIHVLEDQLDKQEDSNEKRQIEHDIEEQLNDLDKWEEKVDNHYEEFQNSMSQYEETRDLYFDTLVEQEERIRKLVQAQLDRIREKYEIEITVNDTQFKIIDYYLDKYGEDIRDFSKAFREGLIKSFDADKIESLFHQISTSQSITDEIINKFLNDPNMTHDKLAEELQIRIEADIDNLNTLQELVDYQLELYGNMADSASEIMQRYIDKMDSMISQLDNYREMASLLGWDKDFDTMNQFYDTQQAAINSTIAQAKGVVDMWNTEFDEIAKRYENGEWKNEVERQMLENKWWEAYDKKVEAEQYLNEQVLKSGQIAQERLAMALEKAAEDFQKGLFKGVLSDDFMTELQRLNSLQEDYLTKTNQMYETNKLIRQAQLDMDKTENQQAKQRYNSYIQHIQQLQDKNKMSQFSLSVAQAEYELLKAQIALEEAQQAKNQVRLTRDANGNFGYVYTANQDSINEAEQAVEDAQNKLYNVALEGTQNYQEQFWNLRQEAAQTFQDLNEKYQNHEITVEEYNRLIAEATEYYTQREKDISEEYHEAYDLLNKISYEKKADYDLKGIDSTENFTKSVNGYLETSKNAFNTFGRETKNVVDALGGSMTGFIGKINDLTTSILHLGEVLAPVVEDLGKMLREVRDSSSSWAQSYGGQIQDYQNKTEENIDRDYDLFEDFARTKPEGGYSEEMMEYIKARLSTNKNLADLNYIMDEKNINLDADVRTIWAYLTARWKDGGKEYDEHQDYSALLDQATDPMERLFYGILRAYKILNTDWMSKIEDAIAQGFTLEDFELDALLRNRKEKNRLKGVEDNTYNEVLALFDRLGKNPYPNNKPYGFDTGGYTGEWGPAGKIGILHQKELVLNKDDTKNLLQSVSIVREISDVLDRSVRSMAYAGGTDLKAALVGALSDQVLQQEVTIEAQFPNVTDHNEIELAIEDLINSASQFALR